MNDAESSKVDMFDVVRRICRKNMAVLSEFTPFVAVFTGFETLLKELEDNQMKQHVRPEGITVGK